ncbi:innexin inx2-like [Rhodnius prolixus]|uniref:Innexin n=1 Tax=Rhodnius prolixus TaxID=13249 RepID=T1HXJ9_RHOPR
MLLEIFTFLKLIFIEKAVNIDNLVFKLHYRITALLLFIFSVLVTARQYFGDPIDCLVQGVPEKVMDSYCWISSTFTVRYLPHQQIGVHMVQPGVKSYIEGEDTVKYHTYYQWVCFVLFFQAVLFYTPHYLWKNWEGGKIKELVEDLKTPFSKEKNIKQRKKIIINYFKNSKGQHNVYIYHFLLCELLNLCNVFAQIYLLDVFLDGGFINYGYHLLGGYDDSATMNLDPMASLFPKVTKCTFKKFGPSGTLQKFDGLCILPVNILNEKIYIILWFWFYILAVVTSLWLLFELIVLASSKLRFSLLKARAKIVNTNTVNSILKKFKIGDWFLLYQISKNMEILTLKSFLEELKRKLNNGKPK